MLTTDLLSLYLQLKLLEMSVNSVYMKFCITYNHVNKAITQVSSCAITKSELNINNLHVKFTILISFSFVY